MCLKLESMNESVNEMEPDCEIAPAETDEKEVSVISDGKDDLVSQFPQDFIAPTAKDFYDPERVSSIFPFVCVCVCACSLSYLCVCLPVSTRATEHTF